MRSFHAWIVRARDLIAPRRRDRDVDAEMAFHLRQQIAEYVQAGMSPQEAARRARLDLGGDDLVKEAVRDLRRWSLLANLTRDLRFAGRLLRRSPGFTTLAIVSLALGIGANTVIFSAVSAVLLRPLPYAEPGRLITIRMAPAKAPTASTALPVPLYTLLHDRSRELEAVGGYDNLWSVNLGPGDRGEAAERLNGHRASPALLRTFGVAPEIGRLYTDDEDRFGSRPTVLLSHEVWQRRFGGDPSIAGRAILLDGAPTTVVGVMPHGFSVLDDSSDFWMPFRLSPANLRGPAHWIYTVARLRPGISIDAASAEVRSIFAEYTREFPDRDRDWAPQLESLHEYFLGSLRAPFAILQGAVVLLLAIACANLAALLLARVPSRQREMAIRIALGESRRGIVRQLLVESVLLSTLGGLAGVALAALALPVLVGLSPAWLLRVNTVSIDARVLWLSVGASIATGVLFGLAPALHGSRLSLTTALKAGGRGVTGTRSRVRHLNALVAAQVMLAFVLLSGAGLLINSFARLVHMSLNSNPYGVLSLQVRLPLAEYTKEVATPSGLPIRDFSPRIPLFYEQAVAALRSLPSVQIAGAVNLPPFTGAIPAPVVVERPRATSTDDAPAMVGRFWITDGYFETMEIPLLAGRRLSARDTEDGAWVVVIDDTMRRQFWPNDNPIGRHLTVLAPDGIKEPPREIVGVVGHVKTQLMATENTPAIYLPHRQQLARQASGQAPWRTRMTFVVRTAGDPRAIAAAATDAIARVDRGQPVFAVRTIESYIDDQIQSPRYFMVLLAGFAGIATLLGAIGIYGVTAHTVALRTQEFGIRRALGADMRSVLGLAARQSLIVITIGLVAGVGVARLATRILAGLLWEVSPTDPLTFASIFLLLALTGLAACLVPAYRATTSDPLKALRSE
jgi:predicted permease